MAKAATGESKGITFESLSGAQRIAVVLLCVDAETAGSWIEHARKGPAATLAVVALFVALATAGFPVTVMIATVAASLGSLQAICFSLVGVVLSSAAGFLVGRFARPSADDGNSSGRVARLVRRFRERGVIGIAILRNAPVAPFAVVNVGCGATSFPLWKFLLGTALGMTPGIVLVSLLGSQVGDWFADPDLAGLLPVIGIAAAVVVCALAAERLFARMGLGRAGSDSRIEESD